MNENTIIKPDDIRKIRPIAENIVDFKRIEPYIGEVERLDVMPAIGVSLYRKIVEDILINKEQWGEFLNGGYYTCDCSCSTDEKFSSGLIAAISYLAYARMLLNQPLNVTAFGAVRKTTTLSEPVDEKTLFRASGEARKIGLEFLRQSVEHLRCMGFIDECKKRDTKRYRKFKAIG